MTTETIGTWAGLAWQALYEADVLDLKQLRKIAKLKDKELCMALGWLAREGKIAFVDSDDDKEILVKLTDC